MKKKKIQKFEDIYKPKSHNSPITVKCVIAGKSAVPYRIPRKVKITEIDKKTQVRGEQTIHTIQVIDEKILTFVDCTHNAIKHILKSVLKIRDDFDYEVLEMQTIYRIFFHQITGEDKSRDNATQMGYVVGIPLDVSIAYKLSGYSTVDPKTQEVTCVFKKATKLQSDIEAFVKRGDWEHLKMFQVKSEDPIDYIDALHMIYASYETNVSNIYGRLDLHMAVDIAFHSCLSFYLGKDYVKKGWIDCMVLGDTRCGKGQVTEGLVNYFGLGEVVSAENSSYAGIVAGLEQIQNHWTVQWGKIPMNDCGLCVVDEAGNLKESWSELSRIRSEGVADITKITKHSTNARTRLIFLSNPETATISSYTYGIEALNSIIKAPEDIARFDYVFIVSNNEVPISQINRIHERTPVIYQKSDERDLLMWIWSREPGQIKFTGQAIKTMFKKATQLGREYDSRIPLIQGENVRLKIARIAIAFAGRFYSTRDGETLLVKEVFVHCAVWFLKNIYEKKSNGYAAMSKAKPTPKQIKKDLQLIDNFLESFMKRTDTILLYCLTTSRLTGKGFEEVAGVKRENIHELISKLVRYNMLVTSKYGTGYYEKTPHFTEWVKKKVDDLDKHRYAPINRQ